MRKLYKSHFSVLRLENIGKFFVNFIEMVYNNFKRFSFHNDGIMNTQCKENSQQNSNYSIAGIFLYAFFAPAVPL